MPRGRSVARRGQRPNGIRRTPLSEWGPCRPSRSRPTGAPSSSRPLRTALVLGTLVRAPVFASGVLLTVHVVTTLGRSYAAAGVLAAAATVAVAVSGPWRGRLLDRFGLRRVVGALGRRRAGVLEHRAVRRLRPPARARRRGRAVRHPDVLDHPAGGHRGRARERPAYRDLARRRGRGAGVHARAGHRRVGRRAVVDVVGAVRHPDARRASAGCSCGSSTPRCGARARPGGSPRGAAAHVVPAAVPRGVPRGDGVDPRARRARTSASSPRCASSTRWRRSARPRAVGPRLARRRAPLRGAAPVDLGLLAARRASRVATLPDGPGDVAVEPGRCSASSPACSVRRPSPRRSTRPAGSCRLRCAARRWAGTGRSSRPAGRSGRPSPGWRSTRGGRRRGFVDGGRWSASVGRRPSPGRRRRASAARPTPRPALSRRRGGTPPRRCCRRGRARRRRSRPAWYSGHSRGSWSGLGPELEGRREPPAHRVGAVGGEATWISRLGPDAASPPAIQKSGLSVP